MTFTNNNFGPGVNNNGPPPMMGGGNTFTNNNFGMAGMNIMNNNGNGHPPSAPNMFVNNNNGMAGAGMSMGMSMNNVMYGMLSDNGDGTYIQPIFVNSEKGKKLIGYNIIANNKIIHTVFNQIVPGSDPAPLTAGPIPGPPGPPGPPGEEKKIKI